MQMQKLVRRHAMASFSKKFYLDTSLSLLRQRLVVSFEFGGQGSLNEDCNHSVFVVLAGANTTSKFSVQHSHNTSFGRTALPQSTPTMGATPFLIFAFRAISGRLKDMFVEDVQKRYRYHPKQHPGRGQNFQALQTNLPLIVFQPSVVTMASMTTIITMTTKTAIQIESDSVNQ